MAKRSGRARQLAAAFVAAALVVSIGAVVVHSVAHRSVVVGSADAPGLPTAGAGKRLVGRNAVVLEVPEDWQGNPCAHPGFADVDGENCLGRPPAESGVYIGADDVGHAGLRAAGSIGGTPVLEGPLQCFPDACQQRVVLPSQDVRIDFSGAPPAARDAVAALRSTLRLLPAGYVAVPDYSSQRSVNLVDVGLARVGLVPVDRLDDARGYFAFQPAAGTVVPTGTTVSVTRIDSADESELDDSVAITAAAQVVGSWLPVSVRGRPVVRGSGSPVVFGRTRVRTRDHCGGGGVPYTISRRGLIRLAQPVADPCRDGLGLLAESHRVGLTRTGRLVLSAKDFSVVEVLRRRHEPAPNADGAFLARSPYAVIGTWQLEGSTELLELSKVDLKGGLHYRFEGVCTGSGEARLALTGVFRTLVPPGDLDAPVPCPALRALLGARTLSLASDGRLVLSGRRGTTIATYASHAPS